MPLTDPSTAFPFIASLTICPTTCLLYCLLDCLSFYCPSYSYVRAQIHPEGESLSKGFSNMSASLEFPVGSQPLAFALCATCRHVTHVSVKPQIFLLPRWVLETLITKMYPWRSLKVIHIAFNFAVPAGYIFISNTIDNKLVFSNNLYIIEHFLGSIVDSNSSDVIKTKYRTSLDP